MKKKILILLLSLCLMPQISFADVVEDSDYISGGDNYQIEKDYNNTHLAFGSTVDVLNKVDGIYGVFGETINYNSINDYLALFGNNVNVNGTIKDGAIFANKVIINNATINRDIIIFANEVQITGNFNGNVLIYANSIDITNSSFKKNLITNSSKLNIDNNTQIEGVLKYNEDTTTNIKSTNIYKVEVTKNDKVELSTKDKILEHIDKLIRLLVIFLVIYLINPKVFSKFSDNVGKNFGYGALTFLLLPIILLILLFTDFATSAAIIGIMLYIIFVMLAKVISGYVIGRLIWNGLAKKKLISSEERVYLIGFIGITVIYLLSIIPYFGVVVTFASLLYSFGIVTNMIIKSRKEDK